MSSEFPYKLDQMPAALANIKALRTIARKNGRSKALAEVLLEIVTRLQTEPHNFGEQRFHTRLLGGTVHFAIFKNLAIDFAIFEEAKLVVIHGFKPYGKHWA